MGEEGETEVGRGGVLHYEERVVMKLNIVVRNRVCGESGHTSKQKGDDQ